MYFTLSNPPAGGISLSKRPQSTHVLFPQTRKDEDVTVTHCLNAFVDTAAYQKISVVRKCNLGAGFTEIGTHWLADFV